MAIEVENPIEPESFQGKEQQGDPASPQPPSQSQSGPQQVGPQDDLQSDQGQGAQGPSQEPKPEVQPEKVEAQEKAVKSGAERVKPARPAKKKSPLKKKSYEALGEKAIGELGSGGDKCWFVVHTLSGQENKVKENLESRLASEEMTELVSQVLIPTENVSEVKSGKKTVTTRKFFPGYVLVNMVLSDKTWYYIRNTSGVIGFVGTGKPVPLQEHEVAEILTQVQEKKEKVKPKVMFDVGENVKVNDGPFVNFTGTVEEVNPDRGKLKVMVSIFGRATPIELEYWQVERS